MKSFLILTILNLFIFSAYSANDDVKFGKVSKSEFEITDFKGDTSYSAIVLYDFGKTYFTFDQTKNQFRVNYFRHKRIKILKKDGYKYATVALSLYENGTGKEGVTNLRGLTYYIADSKIVKEKLKSDSKFREEKSENYNTVKFTMPEVKEGCIIEYEYNIVSDFYWSLKDWYFQSAVPTLYSECIISIPEFYNYKKVMQGYQIYNISESGNEAGTINFQTKTRTGDGFSSTQTSYQSHSISYTNNTNKWVMENVPAFKAEPFMPNEHDYISKMKFEIAYSDFVKFGGDYKNYTQTWEAITNEMSNDENFGIQLKRRGVVKDEVEQITAGISSKKDQMIAIYDYVKNNIKWNDNYGYYTTSTLRQAMNEKNGNVADINMLLTLMLNEADVEAHPVLLSTRSHGKLNFEYPTLSQMNYVISCAMIDGEYFLLDATDENRPYNLLPRRCLNGRGKIICEDRLSEWVDLQNKPEFKKGVLAVLKITEDNSLEASVRTTHSNLAALDERDEITSEGEEKFVENFENEYSNWDFEEIKIENLENITTDLKKSFNANINDYIEEAGNMLFFNPFILERWDENPFKNDTREYPVDFVQPLHENFSITIQIPDNYTVDELPEPVRLVLTDKSARFQYLLSQVGNTIQVVCKLDINRTIYLPSEYKDLQNFFTTVVAKQSEKIVLKKI